MPFKSEKQRKYLWANEPEIARDWTDTYGSGIQAAHGGRIGFYKGSDRHAGTGSSQSQGSDRGPRDAPDRHGPAPSTHGGGDAPHLRRKTVFTSPKVVPDRGFTNYAKKEIKKVPSFLANVGVAKKLNIPYLLAAYGTDYIKDKFQNRDKGTIVPSNQLNEMGMLSGITNLFSRNQNPEDVSLGSGLAEGAKQDIMGAVDQGTQAIEESGVLDELRSQGALSQGGRIGYQMGNMVEGEMEGAMMQSQEVIKELYDALIAEGLSPQEAIEKIKQIIASTQTQEPESPMMAEEFPGQEFGRAPAAFGGIMDTYTGRRKYKLGSLKKKLEKYAPEGESLAFINKEEADLLKSRGGYGRPVNESGIPSFFSLPSVPNPFKVVKKVLKKVKKLASSKFGKIALGYLATAGLSNYLAGAGGVTGGTNWGNLFGNAASKGWMDPRMLVQNVGSSWNRLPFNQTAPKAAVEGSWKFAPEAVKTQTLGPNWMAPENIGKYVNLEKADFIPKVAQTLEGAEKASLIRGIPNKVLAGVAGPSIAAGLYTAAQPPEELGGEVTAEYDDNKAWWDNYLANLDSDYSVNPERLAAEGGRIGRQEGGLMNLGGMEKDYRNDGGFVPIGGEEKADDVPARLSRNEFVFTADAVRNAGGGDIDRGAEVMENVMKNLEGGGKISEESQGQGAQEMFEVSERLSEVV